MTNTQKRSLFYVNVQIPQDGVVHVVAETKEQALEIVQKSLDARKMNTGVILDVYSYEDLSEEMKAIPPEQFDEVLDNVQKLQEENSAFEEKLKEDNKKLIN